MKQFLVVIKYLSMQIVLLFSVHAIANDFMDEAAVKSLVVGNTFYAMHLKKDFEFKVYFDADGKTAIRQQNGETTETTYEFKGNKHCIFWLEKNRCANILDNGDGTYMRVNKNGVSIIKWTKVVKGKDL